MGVSGYDTFLINMPDADLAADYNNFSEIFITYLNCVIRPFDNAQFISLVETYRVVFSMLGASLPVPRIYLQNIAGTCGFISWQSLKNNRAYGYTNKCNQFSFVIFAANQQSLFFQYYDLRSGKTCPFDATNHTPIFVPSNLQR